MTIDDPRLSFLESIGAHETAHNSNEELLPHLSGTRELLRAWGNREALCDAGLFHSVYGTEYFDVASLTEDRRDDVRAVIGAEAEAVAWLWCFGRRTSLPKEPDSSMTMADRRDGTPIPITRQQYDDLIELWIADTLEQLPRMPSREVPIARMLLDYRQHASAQAASALDAILAAYPAS